MSSIVEPHGLNHTLVKGGAGHPRRGLDLLARDWVEGTSIVDLATQKGGAQFGSKRRQMIDFHSVQVRQALIPVVGVTLHHPDFFIDALHMAKRPGAWIVHHLAQVVVVLLQGLLAHNDIPPTGKGPQHKLLWPRLAELKLDDVRVTHVDLADGRKQRCTRDAHPRGWPDDTLVCGLDILSSELPAIMELHAFAQEKSIGFFIGRDFPTVRQVGDDGLATVAWVASNQVVIHTALGTHVGCRTRLMHVKVRWGTQHAVAEHPTPLRSPLGCP